MFQTIAKELALVLAGAGIGWVIMFSFVLSPTVFGMSFERSRGERIIKTMMKNGHSGLAGLILLSGAAALFGGSVGGAVIAVVAAIFTLSCKWALAPRDDRPLRGRRVLKTARIVASALTAAIIPILCVEIFFIMTQV